MREIAEILGLSKSTVEYALKNYKLRGHCETANRSWSKSFLDNGEITFINKKVKKNPKISAPKLAVMLEEERGTIVSSKTVQNSLRRSGLKSCIACTRPFISKKHVGYRLEKCSRWFTWENPDWDEVIFPYECKFNLFYSDSI
jgi:hypothetical protein